MEKVAPDIAYRRLKYVSDWRLVEENHAPFYSRPIECADRDALFVLDGVLYHESDLDLEEHSRASAACTASGSTAPTRAATTASSSQSSSVAGGR